MSVVSQLMHDPREKHLQNPIIFESKYKKIIIQKRKHIIHGSVYKCKLFESVYRTGVICEVLWIKIILDDLKINIVDNLVQHDKTKNIEIDILIVCSFSRLKRLSNN
ncbi:hypothetical protein CR513_18158, partial [Mucuna pruriens]